MPDRKPLAVTAETLRPLASSTLARVAAGFGNVSGATCGHSCGC